MGDADSDDGANDDDGCVTSNRQKGPIILVPRTQRWG